MTLSPAQQQRVRAEEGTFALLRASYLAATAVADWWKYGQYDRTAACLSWSKPMALGTPHTRQSALHRQAEMFVRLYRYDAATTTYHDLVQQWPDDQRARQRLDLLSDHPTPLSRAGVY